MTRTLLAAALSVAVASVVISQPAEAQGRRRGIVEVGSGSNDRHGLYATIGLGGGGQSIRFPGDPRGWSDTRWNPTGTLQVGGAVSPNLRLGGELFGLWDSRQPDAADPDRRAVNERVIHLFAVANLYPLSRSAGFFIRGGGGYGWNRVGRSGAGFGETQSGFGFTGGLGYDIPVGRSVFITPHVEYNQYYFSNGAADPFHQRVLNVGLTVGFQSPR